MNAECRLRIWAMRAISCCADGRKRLGSGGRLAIGVNDYYITVIEVPPKRICRPSCLTYGLCLVPGGCLGLLPRIGRIPGLLGKCKCHLPGPIVWPKRKRPILQGRFVRTNCSGRYFFVVSAAASFLAFLPAFLPLFLVFLPEAAFSVAGLSVLAAACANESDAPSSMANAIVSSFFMYSPLSGTVLNLCEF